MSRRLTIALIVVVLVVLMAVMPVSAGPALSGNETIIQKPFVSATVSPSTVARGDRTYITGTAGGESPSIVIWIFGEKKNIHWTEAVNADGSFRMEVRQEETYNLGSGQYFVVVQHPGPNNKYDIDTSDVVSRDGFSDPWVYIKRKDNPNGIKNYTRLFKFSDSGSLQGSNAAEALVQGINEAKVDDTYTRLQFFVEEPVIRVDPIGDKSPGDKVTITAGTNLAAGDEILIKVNSSSSRPTENNQSGGISVATGIVKVTRSENGLNRISFDVDTSSFPDGDYNVTMEGVIQNDAKSSRQFNVCCGPPTTAATITAVPVATLPRSPGYGTMMALICLSAVVFIVVRRH